MLLCSHKVKLDLQLHWLFKQKALVRLCICTGLLEPSLFAFVISTLFSWAGSSIENHYLIRHITKPNKMICAPSKDLDQPGHPPSLIIDFAVHMKKPWVLSCPLNAQQRPWSDWADLTPSKDSDQRMPRLIWVFAGRTCYFVGFVMWWLIIFLTGIFRCASYLLEFQHLDLSILYVWILFFIFLL